MTRWGALNAVTEFYEHVRGVRGESQKPERRFQSVMSGAIAKKRTRAMASLIAE